MITLENLTTAIKPERTVLLFGAGSSIPSGAPTSKALLDALAASSRIDSEDLDLRELSTVIESRDGRPAVIDTLRPLFKNLRPTGGLLTLPRFEWRWIVPTFDRRFSAVEEVVADGASVPRDLIQVGRVLAELDVPEVEPAFRNDLDLRAGFDQGGSGRGQVIVVPMLDEEASPTCLGDSARLCRFQVARLLHGELKPREPIEEVESQPLDFCVYRTRFQHEIPLPA